MNLEETISKIEDVASLENKLSDRIRYWRTWNNNLDKKSSHEDFNSSLASLDSKHNDFFKHISDLKFLASTPAPDIKKYNAFVAKENFYEGVLSCGTYCYIAGSVMLVAGVVAWRYGMFIPKLAITNAAIIGAGIFFGRYFRKEYDRTFYEKIGYERLESHKKTIQLFYGGKHKKKNAWLNDLKNSAKEYSGELNAFSNSLDSHLKEHHAPSNSGVEKIVDDGKTYYADDTVINMQVGLNIFRNYLDMAAPSRIFKYSGKKLIQNDLHNADNKPSEVLSSNKA